MREKRALVKTASKNYRKNPTNTSALKLKTAQYQLAGIYIKEQTEYIQNQIDKIRDSVEDRQSLLLIEITILVPLHNFYVYIINRHKYK